MRITTASGDLDVSWWIEVKGRDLHLAVDRYVNGALEDVPDSFPVSSLDETVAVLRQLGADAPEDAAAVLWADRPT